MSGNTTFQYALGNNVTTINSLEDFVENDLRLLKELRTKGDIHSDYRLLAYLAIESKRDKLTKRIKNIIKNQKIEDVDKYREDVLELRRITKICLNYFKIIEEGSHTLFEERASLKDKLAKKNGENIMISNEINASEIVLKYNFEELSRLLSSIGINYSNSFWDLYKNFLNSLYNNSNDDFNEFINNEINLLKSKYNNNPKVISSIERIYTEIIKLIFKINNLDKQRNLIKQTVEELEINLDKISKICSDIEWFLDEKNREIFQKYKRKFYIDDSHALWIIYNISILKQNESLLKALSHPDFFYSKKNLLLCCLSIGNKFLHINESDIEDTDDKRVFEYTNMVANWLNDPMVSEEEKEFVKELAYRTYTDNIVTITDYVLEYIDHNKKTRYRFSTTGCAYTGTWLDTKINIDENNYRLLRTFDKVRNLIPNRKVTEDFDSCSRVGTNGRECLINKDEMLLLDYAKAYLLYDLIVSNKIEFLDGVPPFVEDIKKRGKAKTLTTKE